MIYPAKLSDDELKQKLTPQQYAVVRERATEPPFSGKYVNHKEDGMYRCVACNANLFAGKTKFDSQSGWPSFWEAADQNAISLVADTSHGMQRTEVVCKACGAHLGHLFEDGPKPTGQRYCINSLALDFAPQEANDGK